MKTLAEVIYENRKWVRTLGDIPRFNTMPRIRLATSTVVMMTRGLTGVSDAGLLCGVRAFLSSMGADEVWIEYCADTPMMRAATLGAGRTTLTGAHLKSIVGGVEVNLFRADDWRVYGGIAGRIGSTGLTVEVEREEERGPLLDIIFAFAAIAATLAEPGTPAKLAPVDHAEERRTRETNKKRRRMGRDYRVRA